jgi:RNA polymerase sigma-70 factor, ECF subfamily
MTDASPIASSQGELQRLLVGMAKKEEGAFETLYAATKRKLFSTAILIVEHRHLAEEAVQEAYVRIWLNAASYKRPLGSPMNWMITIVRNLAIDMTRKTVWEIHPEESVWLGFPADAPTALDILEDQSTAFGHRLNVLYALRMLDPTQRHLIIAAYIRGESRKQLSERYGVPVNTIKTWIRRALLETRESMRNSTNAAS